MTHRIYSLAGPDGVARYVGQTVRSLENRLYDHRIRVRQGRPAPLYGWMREIGPANVVATLLEECDGSVRLEREHAWIVKLKTAVPDGGLNAHVRGLSRPGYVGTKRSDEVRARMRKAQRASHEAWKLAEFERTGIRL